MTAETRHATTVSVGGRGVAITGPSGSGKSDLALRLIDRGAILVSDDQTLFECRDGAVVASAPAAIAGRIEVRGVGLLPVPHADGVPVVLVIALGEPVERLPTPRTATLAGVQVRLLALEARAASAPIAVERALAHVGEVPA